MRRSVIQIGGSAQDVNSAVRQIEVYEKIRESVPVHQGLRRERRILVEQPPARPRCWNFPRRRIESRTVLVQRLGGLLSEHAKCSPGLAEELLPNGVVREVPRFGGVVRIKDNHEIVRMPLIVLNGQRLRLSLRMRAKL